MTLKVLMFPSPQQAKEGRDGVSQVILAYLRHLPELGVEFVPPEAGDYDLIAGHIHQGSDLGGPYVLHNHGLHWTADYGNYGAAQYRLNAMLVEAIRLASQVTVPSAWVAETFQRDMRFTPHVIPHGIDWDDWQHNEPAGDYVLWNKNRAIGVCDPTPLVRLAQELPKVHFVTTFLPRGVPPPGNANVIGTIPHDQMKVLVQSCAVYLATTKETFGIGILEAMASGVPVLGYAHGGVLDLVQHGVNGYLVQPGDTDGLAEGLAYCLNHRATLGANGREMARAWTWRVACEKVYEVYRLAMVKEPPTVAVVIPVFNQSNEEIERAVQSVVDQSYDHVTEIIVVDDGSEEEGRVATLIHQLSGRDDKIRLIRQSNAGVANARNRGICDVQSKYICCLDPDDWFEPGFLEVCVRALEGDRSLGIAFTGLRFHKPDGEVGISQWPDGWDYDRQLKRKNQVPTACVFRREMWQRLGGYRQRYAPEGAGAEDAEFWLRAGAFGWKAAKVTEEPLFNYSWLSGGVTGDPGYQEVDWTVWAAYTKDDKHPFASYATPLKFSHPVRQYDQPVISVIIPVGPGHERNVVDALDSLEAQSFRRWEAVVVWDAPLFEKATHFHDSPAPLPGANEGLEALTKAYPYVRWFITSPDRSHGAGYARNRGAEIARAPFLFFLDADDWLYDRQALDKMLKAWNEYQSIVYSDYVGRAFYEDPKEAEKLRKAGRLIGYDENTGETLVRHKAFDFDCERILRQPELPKPYTFCLISTLTPKLWHDEIGGFDEAMPSWEDVDYQWRMVRSGKCFYRIPEPLLLYRFYTGHRREGGRQNFESLVQYIQEKYEGSEPEVCSNCPGSKPSATSTVFRSATAQAAAVNAVDGLKDEDFVKIKYVWPNRGDHPVVGTTAINPVTKRTFKYGQHAHGEEFLVHREDVFMTDRSGQTVLRDAGRFQPVRERVVKPPKEEKKELPAPVAVVEPPEDIEVMTIAWKAGESIDQAVDDAFEFVEATRGAALENLVSTGREDTGDTVTIRTDDGISDKEAKSATDILLQHRQETTLDFQTLPGVNSDIAGQLEALGLETRDDILAFGVVGLETLKGIGEVKAQRIIKAIEGMKDA